MEFISLYLSSGGFSDHRKATVMQKYRNSWKSSPFFVKKSCLTHGDEDPDSVSPPSLLRAVGPQNEESQLKVWSKTSSKQTGGSHRRRVAWRVETETGSGAGNMHGGGRVFESRACDFSLEVIQDHTDSEPLVVFLTS